MQQKYGEKAKLYHIDTDSFIISTKTENIYKDIAEDVETIFDTLNYEIDRPFPRGNNNVFRLMKDELGGKIMTDNVNLTPKKYSYLVDAGDENKKTKSTKECVIKQKHIED